MMDLLSFIVNKYLNNFKQFFCKEQKEIANLKEEIEVDSEGKKFLNIITESTNEKKNSNFNYSEKRINSKNFSEFSIIEKNRIIHSEKMLEISPPINFPNLFLNYKNIIIDEYGLEGSSDNFIGKKIFFGINNSENKNNNFNHVNDVIINEEIIKTNLNKTIPLFYIFFEQRIKHYLLKSLSKGVYFSLSIGSYSQILLDIKHKNYFKIGNIVLSISINKKERNINIKLKKGKDIKNEINYDFNFDKFPISIGRINCTIDINNDLISKNHICINYDKVNDIFFLVDNGSTNGTQLLLNQGKIIQLSGEMDFNIEEKQFKIIEK